MTDARSDYTKTSPNNRSLISFDIDGTLEMGDPPGPVTIEMVRRAKEMGYVVGSCSDRPVGSQKQMWEANALVMDFTVLKHQLPEVKALFKAEAYCHVGDRELDRQFAHQAGFDFLWPGDATREPWALDGPSGGKSG
ncbi:MAG: HAD family hydrolase [Dehalococcoidia bacterium]